MDDDLDENGNFYLRFVLGPWSPEQQAIADSIHKEMGYKPISPSFYEATSHSMDYVDKSTNIISDLLKKRKTESNDGDYEMVLVWDIGEITTATCEHFMQILSSHRDTDAQSLLDIIKLVLRNVEFCQEFDFLNVVNIEDVDEAESEEMKQRAPMYDALEEFYNEISDGMRDDGPIINYELIERCGLIDEVRPLYSGAVQMQRLFHQRWKTARKCLEMVNKQSAESKKNYANVVVCENGIGCGAGQLLLSGNSQQIPFENIYSFNKGSKEMIFERIRKRFGEKCVLVYITSEPNIASISEKLQIPIWEIRANDSIEHLCNALQTVLFL